MNALRYVFMLMKYFTVCLLFFMEFVKSFVLTAAYGTSINKKIPTTHRLPQ